MELNAETAAALVGAALGGGGLVAVAKVVTEYLLKRHRMDAGTASKADRFIADLLREYKDELTTLRGRLNAMWDAHQDCQKQNADLRERIGSLQQQVDRNQQEITDLKAFSCSVAGCSLRREITDKTNREGA